MKARQFNFEWNYTHDAPDVPPRVFFYTSFLPNKSDALNAAVVAFETKIEPLTLTSIREGMRITKITLDPKTIEGGRSSQARRK